MTPRGWFICALWLAGVTGLFAGCSSPVLDPLRSPDKRVAPTHGAAERLLVYPDSANGVVCYRLRGFDNIECVRTQ